VGLFSRTTDKPVALGTRYRDSITGFEGVATARYEFLYGCVRVLLEGTKDGKPAEYTFDEQRLTDVPSATSGGPAPEPPSRDPSR
jgi:hypothetical protein